MLHLWNYIRVKPAELPLDETWQIGYFKMFFNQEGPIKYRSSTIRGTGRAIVERAFQLGLISGTDLQHARPPFSLKFEMLPLDKLAAQTSESYGPIWHDLAWY